MGGIVWYIFPILCYLHPKKCHSRFGPSVTFLRLTRFVESTFLSLNRFIMKIYFMISLMILIMYHKYCGFFCLVKLSVMCPIWTPDGGHSGPSDAQRRAMAGLWCLLRSGRGGHGVAGRGRGQGASAAQEKSHRPEWIYIYIYIYIYT